MTRATLQQTNSLRPRKSQTPEARMKIVKKHFTLQQSRKNTHLHSFFQSTVQMWNNFTNKANQSER